MVDTKEIRLQFESSIENLIDINDSFALATIQICYTGKNRNGSFISKKAIEKAIPTMYNCPVVCNYNVVDDSIGGHDMELVCTEDGDMKFINLTDAIGVIPKDAKVWWSKFEDNGVEHEYLCAEAILWKRTPAFEKIKEDGICSQSMEISVKSGYSDKQMYVIEDFTFTAFCLLGEGIEPCFESANLQMFAFNDVRERFSLMMTELKESFNEIQSSKEAGIQIENHSMEGGDEVMEQKNALMAEFGIKAEDLDFNIEGFSVQELREKFTEMTASDSDPEPAAEPAVESEPEGEPEEPVTEPVAEGFALAEQFRENLLNALSSERVETSFGEMPRFIYLDYDAEAKEVYCHDVSEEWRLYGIPFSMDGDNVLIDFKCKKRKKFSIVDFDEGEQSAVFSEVFNAMSEKFRENDTQWQEKFEAVNSKVSSLEAEIVELCQFKADAILDKFEDLKGDAEFTELCEKKDAFNAEELKTLEKECFAIRGRIGVPAKFAQDVKNPKLPIGGEADTKPELYGGLFREFGY